MKKTLIALTLVVALSGCATIEKHLAASIISRYVGIWTKDGATQDDLFVDSSRCVLAERGNYVESHYRQCMQDKGWHLEPVEIN